MEYCSIVSDKECDDYKDAFLHHPSNPILRQLEPLRLRFVFCKNGEMYDQWA